MVKHMPLTNLAEDDPKPRSQKIRASGNARTSAAGRDVVSLTPAFDVSSFADLNRLIAQRMDEVKGSHGL